VQFHIKNIEYTQKNSKIAMPLPKVEKIWMNGKLVDWDDAKIHVLSHVIHYGTSWFEGIRCYNTKKGSAIFRLREHLERLYDSVKIYRAEIPYAIEELTQAVINLIKVNKLKACYIRPIVFRGYYELGVNPMNCPIDVVIAVWEWGEYLGKDAVKNGVDVKVSSWRRPAPDTLPMMAKVGANYMNSQLIKMEALVDGYAEGIALDYNGFISEGSGENIFIIKNGVIYTPPISTGILPGITRISVIKIANDLGYEVKEALIPREMLYIADEIFLCGTATEITPVISVDRIKIGCGAPGKITRSIQDVFYDIVENGNDRYGWLTWVE
jgi:branched-chain amino acid aminotransferase